MSVTIDDFWKLIHESQLLSAEECRKLREKFASEPANQNTSVELLSDWLVEKVIISRYQADILLAGSPGPFVYGDYRIYDRIESGRMAGIFRALHLPTKHRVCLYFLTGDEIQDPAIVADLSKRAAVANRLSMGHPHLFRCYHLEDLGAYKFVVVEDLQGKRVARLLATKGPQPPSVACRIVRQAALGLARLHSLGHIHGEVRPANLWLHTSGTVELLHFPLAREPLLDPMWWLRQSDPQGKVPEEADYVAPELIGGDRQPDVRSDIYSLGCTLYRILTNKSPFPGGTLQEKLHRHAHDEPTPLTDLQPEVSPELAKLVRYMMQKDPDLRYQQATSVVEKLLPHLSAGDDQSRPRPSTRPGQAYEKWLQKHVNPALAAEAAAAVRGATTPTATQPAAAHQAAAPAAVAAQPAARPMAQPLQPVRPAAQPVAAQLVVAAAAVQRPVAAATPVMAAPVNAAPAAVAAPVGMAPAGMAAPAGAPIIGVPSGGATSVIRRRRRSGGSIAVVGVLLALMIGGVGYAFYSGMLKLDSGEPAPVAAPQPEKEVDAAVQALADAQAKAAAEAAAAAAAEPKEELYSLDESIWQSPTKGAPIAATYLPLGVQAVFALRPADMIAHAEAEKLLDERVLGAPGAWVKNQISPLVGVPLESIEQIVIGLLTGTSSTELPGLALVAQLRDAVPEDTLKSAWTGAAPQEVDGNTYYVAGDRAWWLPPAGEGKLVVMAPAADMSDIIGMAGQSAPPLQMEIEALLKLSDRDRHFTMVLSPQYLNSGGKALLWGAGERLRSPIEWFLTGYDPSAPAADPATAMPTQTAAPEPPKAVLVSAHLGDQLFGEIRIYDPEAATQLSPLAGQIKERIDALPKRIDRYIRLGLNTTAYSYEVLYQYPRMIEALEQYTRVAVGDKQVVLRAYLPAAAAHNLALGSYLSILESPRGDPAVAVAAAPQAAAPPKEETIEDKLNRTVSLQFPRDTLERSMILLSEQIDAEIIIQGGDLQLEGITKNQSFSIDEQNQPAKAILQKIFMMANPDGKLVYVIKKDDAGKDVVWITTRAAAAKRGDTLPPEFQQ